MKTAKVIGGGLAGSEAAYQLLKRGYCVELYEMRPKVPTAIHKTEGLAELVCSNSLKSTEPSSAQGALKRELKLLDSVILSAAEETKVPAGAALAVDRAAFQTAVEARLRAFPAFRLIREEVSVLTEDTVIATGPLTSDKMYGALKEKLGDFLAFYDAVAPIITTASVDMGKAYYAARYGKGDADYINCPMNKVQYEAFVSALTSARVTDLHEFEKGEIFEGCMPVEVMAKRGTESLRFGPLRPVGLRHPETGESFYAVLQLRKEDTENRLVNLVGFQTNLAFPEQERVFRMIPGLEGAEFVRHGVMHRNTFVNAPSALDNALKLKGTRSAYLAGQMTGVEGYLESVMSGLFAGINLSRALEDEPMTLPPAETVSGGLLRYLTRENKDFQPMHVAYELVPPLENPPRDKKQRKQLYSDRAVAAMENYIKTIVKE